jgi:hypothetical protein
MLNYAKLLLNYCQQLLLNYANFLSTLPKCLFYSLPSHFFTLLSTTRFNNHQHLLATWDALKNSIKTLRNIKI